jgi:hypothetical protein
LAVVMGAAALLGLLFFAVSIRVETIARSTELRNRSAQTRSAQTLTLLLRGLLSSALLAVPDQRDWTPVAEYLALALVAIGVAFSLDRWAGSQSGSTIARLLDAINPTSVTCSLLVVAAVILMLGHTVGIYVLVPALIAVLAGGAVNGWLTLVRLTNVLLRSSG